MLRNVALSALLAFAANSVSAQRPTSAGPAKSLASGEAGALSASTRIKGTVLRPPPLHEKGRGAHFRALWLTSMATPTATPAVGFAISTSPGFAGPTRRPRPGTNPVIERISEGRVSHRARPAHLCWTAERGEGWRDQNEPPRIVFAETKSVSYFMMASPGPENRELVLRRVVNALCQVKEVALVPRVSRYSARRWGHGFRAHAARGLLRWCPRTRPPHRPRFRRCRRLRPRRPS